METITIYSSITSGGDGSAFNHWVLTLAEAQQLQEEDDEGWAEECISKVETYIGSNVHKRAVRNSGE